MPAKTTVGVLGIFLVGIALGLIVNTFTPLNLSKLVSGDVSTQVEKLYELVNPGVDVDVVKVELHPALEAQAAPPLQRPQAGQPRAHP